MAGGRGSRGCSPGSMGTFHLLERVGLLGNLCLGRFGNMRQDCRPGGRGSSWDGVVSHSQGLD